MNGICSSHWCKSASSEILETVFQVNGMNHCSVLKDKERWWFN